MLKEISEHSGLPTLVTNPDTEDDRALTEQLQSLTRDAFELGKSIVSQSKDVDVLWERLLPILHEVKEMLSKHSRRKIRRFPHWRTWQEWRRTFLEQTGLRVSDRTAQRRLATFEELMGCKEKRGNQSTAASSSAEKYQILCALQAANALAAALEEDEYSSEALAEYITVRIDPDRLFELLRKCKKPKGASIIADRQSSATTVGMPRAIPFRVPRSAPSPDYGFDFMPTDRTVLTDYISVEHGHQIEAVFALPPTQMAREFELFVKSIAEAHLPFDHDSGALEIHVVYVERKPGRAA